MSNRHVELQFKCRRDDLIEFRPKNSRLLEGVGFSAFCTKKFERFSKLCFNRHSCLGESTDGYVSDFF